VRFVGSEVFKTKLTAQQRDLRPTFTTLLGGCAAAGVPLTHLIEDPVGAARGAGLLEFARLTMLSPRTHRVPLDRYPQAAEVLKRESGKPQDTPILSLDEVVNETGIGWQSLARVLPKEAEDFRIRRLNWLARKKELAHQAVIAALRGGLLARYLSGELPSQDHVTAELRKLPGVTVGIAREELNIALHKRRNQLSDRCKRRRNWKTAHSGSAITHRRKKPN
jgi:hypothetical protein